MAKPDELVIPVPGSKSDAIRALVVGAVARGATVVRGAPPSADVEAVLDALGRLGVRIGDIGNGDLVVRGRDGAWKPGPRELHLGGSATGLRLLAAVAVLRSGRTRLSGDASLRRRPMDELVEPLTALGVTVAPRRGGLAPVTVRGGPAAGTAATVVVDASRSSQFASGLLLVAPSLPGGLRVRVPEPVVSRPYLEMTVRALRRAGGRLRRRGDTWTVKPGSLHGGVIEVERDWSSAAFALVGAAIHGRRVRVPGLRRASAQPDRAVLALLEASGARTGCGRSGAWCAPTGRPRRFDVDLRDAPDLAPAAAALALFAKGTSRVRGAAHLRHKESDRIAACVAAVRALGGKAEETEDGFVVTGGAPSAGSVNPRRDHRIALAFRVAAAAVPGARVSGMACVAKSWPAAEEDLAPLLGG